LCCSLASSELIYLGGYWPGPRVLLVIVYRPIRPIRHRLNISLHHQSTNDLWIKDWMTVLYFFYCVQWGSETKWHWGENPRAVPHSMQLFKFFAHRPLVNHTFYHNFFVLSYLTPIKRLFWRLQALGAQGSSPSLRH